MIDLIMGWAAVVGFSTLAAVLSLAAFDRLCRGRWVSHDPEEPVRLKIPADCPKIGSDFIVDLECPDGGIVRVLIPSDAKSHEGICSRICDNDHCPVGLNLISPGHYT